MRVDGNRKSRAEGIVDDAARMLKQISDEISAKPTQSFGEQIVAEVLPFVTLSDRTHIAPLNNANVIDEISKTKPALGYDKVCQNISEALLLGRSVPLQIMREVLQQSTEIAVEILSNTVFVEEGKPYGV